MSAEPTDNVASPPSAPPNKPSDSHKSHRRNASASSLASRRSSGENHHPASSPLKQVNSEPLKHELKVVGLYNQLFSSTPHHPGYWVEFFLLKANKPELTRVLASNPQNFVKEPGLTTIHTLVRASVANLSADLPADIVVNALQVLTAVLGVTLDLQGSNPSTAVSGPNASTGKSTPPFSVILALTGVDHASAVFDELTSRLLALLYLKDQTKSKAAVDFLLHTARKLWGSQISGLFSTKNFFAALIGIIDDKITDQMAINALTCIGVLTGVNVYGDDVAAIYKQRLNDYVDVAVMAKILALVQQELLHRDLSPFGSQSTSEPPSSSVFSWVSKWFADSAPNSGDSVQPSPSFAVDRVILPLFLFTIYNAVFSSQFAASPALPTLLESSVLTKNFCLLKNQPSLALAHSRTWLSLLAMRNLIDNDFLVVTSPTYAAPIRLNHSKLVLDSSRRLPVAGILDFAVLIVQNGFVKPGADVDFRLVEQALDVLYQVCAQMAYTRTILAYNWTQLWKVLVSALKCVASEKLLVSTPIPPVLIQAISRMLSVLVGMSLRRDLLEEEDWRALLFVVVYNASLFKQLASQSALPMAPLKAAQAMAAQYELSPDQPDFAAILRQGVLVAPNLIGERLRPFSISCQDNVKGAVKQQIVG